MHPTKREVGFEDADEIVELVCDALAKTLEKDGGSRTFKVQVRFRSPLIIDLELTTGSDPPPRCETSSRVPLRLAHPIPHHEHELKLHGQGCNRVLLHRTQSGAEQARAHGP